MRILIVGLGGIGRRHLNNLKTLEPKSEVIVWHTSPKRPESEADSTFIDKHVYSLTEALATQPEAAFITGPAVRHVEVGLALAQMGIHLFIEKPLSDSLDNVDVLITLCRSRNLVLMVGYNFHFYPPLQILRQSIVDGRIGRPLSLQCQVGQYLPDWRPGRNYRDTVTARRDLGGGVLLELSHEIDYALWLLGSVAKVSAYAAQVSDLEIDVDDVAEITLQFTNGAIGHIHLDMLRHAPYRTCSVIGTHGTLNWSWQDHRLQLFADEYPNGLDLFAATTLDRNEMYVSEVRHYFECIRTGQRPQVSGEVGRAVLDVVLTAKKASEQQRFLSL